MQCDIDINTEIGWNRLVRGMATNLLKMYDMASRRLANANFGHVFHHHSAM